MTQLTLDDALQAGSHGMSISLERAERSDPEFGAKARAAILAHLSVVGSCSGEVLTDIARAKGAIPPDDRAFGAVFKKLSTDHQIQCVGFCLRTKGRGTAGGRVWALVR